MDQQLPILHSMSIQIQIKPLISLFLFRTKKLFCILSVTVCFLGQQISMANMNTEQSRISNVEEKLASVSRIITIDPQHRDGSRLGARSKRQIEQWLQAEARLLIDKKERYQQKQQKLKQLEEQFQKRREIKQHQIEQKIDIIQHNKNRNLQCLQKKLSGVANRHQSVISRHRDDQSREMERLFDQRKSFQIQANRPSSKGSNLSRLSSTSKSKILKPFPKDEEIEKSIQEINSRLNKAKSTYNQRKSTEVNRVRNHNTSDIREVQQRGKNVFQNQQNIFTNKITKRMMQASQKKEDYDQCIEKKIEEKQKAYSFKLRVCQDNLKSIENQQTQKIQELNKKFERSRSGEKSWKDERGSVYQRKFLANLSLLQQQKVSRADKIIQKHLEISDKNRVYKERKDSLVKAIKHTPNIL